MSVLACDRTGCTRIMCDHYSHTFGYICRDCMAEAINKGVGNDEDMRDFMNTYPSEDAYKMSAEDYVYGTFELRD